MNNENITNYICNRIPFESRILFKSKNNRIISIQKRLFFSKIIIHPVFLNSDKNILNDLINIISNKNIEPAKKRLNTYFQENIKKRKSKINIKYKYNDINNMFIESINDLYKIFDLDFSALKITWGRKSSNRRRAIRFGSYDKTLNLIRIHPILDNKNVPDHFIRSIILHEIAHHIVRLIHNDVKPHSKEFKEIYKKIDTEHEKSRKWEKANKRMFFIC